MSDMIHGFGCHTENVLFVDDIFVGGIDGHIGLVESIKVKTLFIHGENYRMFHVKSN